MENKIEMFEKICEYSKNELDFDLKLNSTEFDIYSTALCADSKLLNDRLKMSVIINMVYNAYIKTERENDISIGYIVDYVVYNYDKIIKQEMTSYQILDGAYDYFESDEENA